MSKMTSNNLKLLGTISDQKLADQLGVCQYTIFRHRKALGIKAWGDPERIWTPAAIALLGTARDAVVAEIIGIEPRAVKEKRARLNIACYKPQRVIKPIKISKSHQWTEEQLSWLGVKSDSWIARKLTMSRKTISRKRSQLNIPAYSMLPGSEGWIKRNNQFLDLRKCMFK